MIHYLLQHFSPLNSTYYPYQYWLEMQYDDIETGKEGISSFYKLKASWGTG